ncbi:hypothetical protein V491_04172, partial [Pseudogymnoascus sp. VKM F-3775]
MRLKVAAMPTALKSASPSLLPEARQRRTSHDLTILHQAIDSRNHIHDARDDPSFRLREALEVSRGRRTNRAHGALHPPGAAFRTHLPVLVDAREAQEIPR